MSSASRSSISARSAVFALLLFSLLTAAVLLTPPRPAQARYWVRKLSGVLPAGASIGSAYGIRYEISPDSQWVVYGVLGDPYGSVDLYSVPIHGGAPIRLTPPGFGGREIAKFMISPNSSLVVYGVCAYPNDKTELYSVPIDGSSNPVRISSSEMIPEGDVHHFLISPDSARVVYRSDQEVDEQEHLYSVPIGGGAITRINHDLASNAYVSDFELTPDGQRVVFDVHNGDTGLIQLFFTPIDVQDVRRLDGGPAAGMSVWEFEVLPDSSGAVYSANQVSPGAEDVYRADFYTGSTQPSPVRLTNAPDPSMLYSELNLTSDGGYVVFTADYTVGSNPEYWRVRTHPTGSSDVVRLHPALGSERGADYRLKLTPNGYRAVFVIQEIATGKEVLYSNTVALPLTTPHQLSQAPASDNTGADYFEVSADNLGVVFRSDAEENGTYRLYSNWITGGALISLTPSLVGGGSVYGSQISPDSMAVIYRADGITNDQLELFIVPTGGPGTAPRRISGPIANAFGDVLTFQISPDGEKVIYIADADTDGKNELYVVEDLELQFLPLLKR